ncbi:hypothetical protein H072_6304 [Dactylellina haptotyla CBS 200.50]|uniref:Uncharacterized protein n=1 Tax=Dactylellina haptotyla (strain CBS 200.50) TaxID=1284197 RepID=S8AAI3_DACHA|nr:hypothetical protein H072_6304 [Dactylellina haptotyla CBS 200.50]
MSLALVPSEFDMFRNSFSSRPQWAANTSGPNYLDPGRTNNFNRFYQEFRRQFGLNNSQNGYTGWPPWSTSSNSRYPFTSQNWQDDDRMRFEFLDSLRGNFSGNGNIYDSWANSNRFLRGGPPGRCKYRSRNGTRCGEQRRNPYTRFCDFHSFSLEDDGAAYDSPSDRDDRYTRRRWRRGSGNRYSRFTDWASHDPRSAAYEAAMADHEDRENMRRHCETRFNRFSKYHDIPFDYSFNESGGPSLSPQQAVWISIREIDVDNWPFYLKCGICRKILNDPVHYTNPTTSSNIVACRSCVPSAPSGGEFNPQTSYWRAAFFPQSYAGSGSGAMSNFNLTPATEVSLLRSYFEQNFTQAIQQEAPRQICYFCQRPMTNPVVTCTNVPPQFWGLTHGNLPPIGPVKHAFCMGCLDDYRYKGAAVDFATCPFRDNCWNSSHRFALDGEYHREAQAIAGRAWDKALQMAQFI